jgi:chemotaxis protein methyltransferase CheR
MPEQPSLPMYAFNMLRELIQERTGLYFDDDKEYIIADKLHALVAAQGFDSFLDYYYLLKYGDQAEQEWKRLSSALAVNETYFWREFDQVQAVAEVVAPQFHREHPGETLRIWVAACASGEEPYSLVMALEEAGCYGRGPIEIVGTDFNEAALTQAREAVYRKRSFRSIPEPIFLRYFTEAGQERHRLIDPIRAKVQFEHLNLMDKDRMGWMKGFHLIFCRNAFIYFSTPAIQQVLDHFFRALVGPGYLFVAAAESLLKVTQHFELVEVENAYAYRKLPANER